jgi:dihydrofolate reductase
VQGWHRAKVERISKVSSTENFQGSDQGPVFTKAIKYVLPRGLGKLDWANSHRIRDIDDLPKVEAGEDPDILLWGSSTLYPQLLEANLIVRLL